MIKLPDARFDNSSSGGVWRHLSLPAVPSDWLPGVSLAMETVAAFVWNGCGWQASRGISDRLGVEYASKHRGAFCESYRARRNSITTLIDVMVVFPNFLIV